MIDGRTPHAGRTCRLDRSQVSAASPAMYLDIPANDNCDEPCMATFNRTGDDALITAIRLWEDDHWQWHAVTGWDEIGAVPARFAAIEESGDGPARLLHGGPLGLRLARIDDPLLAREVRWSLDDTTQWGETFRIVTPETQTR